ncbi:MAG: SRPBCC family protein [Nitrosopumilus sp.]|nr:SRPBCC family protein [Nitrosopumilus sp.]MDH3515856.1 SRPBCC family protein [Nitrosopumilus sp.]MDH3564779.1 SRPBCC family protein [Nitrosopumilus sp.]MDH5418027.1 SRPBCC family protein [Nitrosopumilus sp.]MDH5555261.1 SRPBCC family protein [Nitrosopumilus sp.]
MIRFSFEKIVNAKREYVFEIFSNFENYQKLFPQHFPSIRIRSVRNDVSVVEEHFNLGSKELLIMAKHVSKTPVLHEVFVIGGDGKGSHIQEQFIDVLEGTKILVDVNLKLKGKMKIRGLFTKNKFQLDYEHILNDFIKSAEN